MQLADGKTSSVVTITRTGHFSDPRYGKFDISRDMLLGMVANFDAGTYGQDIFLDISHKPENGAAGKFTRLFVEGNRLRGEVAWTPYGIESVRSRGYQYLSAEYHEDFEDNEKGEAHGPVLMGAALTVRPVIKRLDPVQLAEAGDQHVTLLHPELVKTLSQEITIMWKALLAKLKKTLAEFKALPEAIQLQLAEAFEASLQGITDEAQAKVLLAAFTTTGTQLSEQLEKAGGDSGAIKLDFSGLETALQGAGGRAAAGLDQAAVLKLMEDQETKRLDAAKKLTEGLDANRKRFTDALENAEGLKTLSEGSRTMLAEAGDLITAAMTPEQVDALAAHSIKLGNDLVAQSKLVSMGYPGPSGSVHISVDDANSVKALQEAIDRRLGILDLPDSRRYAATGGTLLAENKAFAERVLAQFDADPQHRVALAEEHKHLAAGDGIVSDVAVPVVWERTVIREALYRLIGLQFVDSGSESFATSYMIPYSYRDTAAGGIGSARRYEGQSIARAGVIQTAETAYNTPQKLAFEVSDELRYLTAANHLNWDAIAENQRNASRIIGEDTERLIFNEVLHAADEFGAVVVASENMDAQTDGTDNVFILANFPVVRPRSVYDLQGNQVGSTVNPVTITFKGGAIPEYDGTGTQAAGNYYTLDYNLGELRIVTELGALTVPLVGDTLAASYSYSSNVYAFNTDPGAVAVDAHWDTFLYRFGLRKAVIEDDRFHMANFGLMSGSVMTQVEQAKQFGANSIRAGTDLAGNGNLGRIKDVPNFRTTAPALWMGDQRALIGERGQTRLRMTKPWTLGELENQKDANGRFTGKKEAYGDQFLVLHTPTQLKRAYTSLVLYSAAARVDRVE